MTNAPNRLTSLLHRLGVAGPARVRAFQGTGAPSRTPLALALFLTIVAAMALFTAPALALNDHVFASSFAGPGAGQVALAESSGVAVDDATHDVYVADTGNARVDEFDSTGTLIRAWGWGVADGITDALQTCTLTCFAGIPGPGAGQFTTPTFIAVDNSAGASQGDVYVADTGNRVIDKFGAIGEFLGQITTGEGGAAFGGLDGVAVDSGGVVWVYAGVSGEEDGVIDSYSDALVNVFGSARKSRAGGYVEPGFAVDSEDNLYVVHRESRIVAKLNSAGEVLGGKPGEEFGGAGPKTAVAVDSSGDDVYIGNGSTIEAFAASGGLPIESFGSGDLNGAAGLGVDASTDTVYAADVGDGRIDAFDSTPDVTTGQVSNQTGTGATVNGTVNPLGAQVTDCHFDYGTETSYGLTAACVPTSGSGIGAVAVHADLSGLQAGIPYHFRLEATNAAGTTLGQDQGIAAPPKVDSTSVVNLTSTSVDLQAQITPDLAVTTYHFQYVDDATFQADKASGDGFQHATQVPQPDVDLGAAGSEQSAGAHVQGLTPRTIYHYRVVATNTLGIVDGLEQVFTTQPAGSEFALPDGRAWELVSPLNEHGATIEAITSEGGLIQASEDGDAVTYVASAPIEAGPMGNPAPEETQVLAERQAAGWVSQDIATPHNALTGVQSGHPAEYMVFSRDLSLGLIDQQGDDETPLSPEVTEKTVYLRHDATCEATPMTCYEPLVSENNVPSGTKFGNKFGFEGATPDLTHIVLASGVALTSTSAPEGGLYEWTGGHLQLVSVLPERPESEGGTPAVSPVLGHEVNARHAISNNGSRIFWSAEGHLYMRDMVTEETVQIDANQGGPLPGPEPREAQFQTASSEGSRVFFTDAERLTEHSTAKSEYPPAPDLYEYDVESGKLTDLAVDPNTGESADVQGLVIGASEDGSSVYFVANGALASGAAPGDCVNEAGGATAPPGATCNLYVEHYNGTKWTPATFIASLSNQDERDWGSASEPDLGKVTSRVSPDGRYLAFMSERSLTGYDNIDANGGVPDEEVFLYDATRPVSPGNPVCASCDPTGARPVGVFDSGEAPGLLVDRRGAWGGHWLAGSIPGWTSVSLGDAFYQSRYLSDSGRLFFDSADALVPQDTHGVENVYEYEPEGEGSCQRSSETFSEKSVGCVSLISSGTSSEESAFLDASESGNDVFFLTASQLVPQDVEGGLAVYDAHVCGAEGVACAAAAGSSPPPCTTADSCRPAPSPQPAIFGASGSATFSGAGNLAPLATKPASKPLTREQKLAKALKACRKKKNKRKRVACEKQATKSYGAKASGAGRSRKANESKRGRG